MSYIQVVSPNLSVVGIVGLCEKYTEDVFGVTTARHDADALLGWEQDKGQHPGEVPPNDVSVPLAFNWTGTVDKVTKNWGHRCVWVKGTIYSSPLSGTGHVTYPSIPAIQAAFGLGAYLGFSEFIEDLQIIKESDMLTPAEVNQLAQIAFNRPAHDDEKSVYSSIPSAEALQRILDGAENKSLRTDAQAFRDGQQSTSQYVPYTGSPLFTKKG